jgi:hypothetical protein
MKVQKITNSLPSEDNRKKEWTLTYAGGEIRILDRSAFGGL